MLINIKWGATMHWGARERLKNAAKTTLDRTIHYADETKDNLNRYNPKNKDANTWDEQLDKGIARLEYTLDSECIQWFRQTWEESLMHAELDEEEELEIKPFFDKAEAKFVEFKDKTVDELKRRPGPGWSKGWTITDWAYAYERAMDDLADYVADMNNDINDGSDSE
ncbi:unnamed protein product [Penicillium pancosmium]